MSDEPLASPGSFRSDAESAWSAATIHLHGPVLEIRPTADSLPITSIRLDQIDHVDEVAPFDEDPATIELRLGTGATIQASATRSFVEGLCAALATTTPAVDPSPMVPAVSSSTASRAAGSRTLRAAAAATVIAVVGVAWWQPGFLPLGASGTERTAAPTTTLPPARGARAVRATMPTTTTTIPPTTVPPEPPPPPVPMAVAPLTGLEAPASALMRPALVSKIDASLPAMPQVGMEFADVVYEVRIEFGSRYLAVWHSQEPDVVGPHRSARTTDPDLLSMFGHPLFAFSGANDGVVDTLALTTWKTGVGPGEVARAYFRDDRRPWPHNLFAHTNTLRTRRSPLLTPPPMFHFHSPDAAPPGVPVEGFSTQPGTNVEFRWDPALDGWRRKIWDREHYHASGEPVAPNNVVVIETEYGTSHADIRSPEAISVGSGRAWVFTNGQVRQGTWARWHRNDPWNVQDASGWPLTLDPGKTWVVLAEGQPRMLAGS